MFIFLINLTTITALLLTIYLYIFVVYVYVYEIFLKICLFVLTEFIYITTNRPLGDQR